MDKDDRELLNRMIEKYGLAMVLSETGSLCSARAEHFADICQDPKSGKQWMGYAAKLDAIVAKLD